MDEVKVPESVLKHREASREYRKKHPDYQNEYMKSNFKQMNINLSRVNDADIIQFLESLPRGAKDPYVKALIRQDMQKRKD